jgi:hypothetical protein
MRRRLVSGLVMTATVLLAGCAPDPAPTASWRGTRIARSVSAGTAVNFVGAWTDQDWFATVRTTTPSSGTGTAELLVYPRSGPAGRTLGTPQVSTLPPGVGITGPLGEHVVALPTGTGALFYRPVAGTWGPAGSVTVPDGYQVSAVTDRWLAARRVPGAPGATGDGEVRLYALDTSGTDVVATPAATLGPDPIWPTALREGFGQQVALDGDLLAVSASGFNAPSPGGVRMFRATAGSWAPVQSLGAGSAPQRYGAAIAVDDGATVDRIVVATQYDALLTIGLDVLADTGTGGGFVAEQSLVPDTTQPDQSGGLLFGSSLALDGDLLALTARSTTVASVQADHAPVTVGHVQVFRRGPATWAREGEVGTFTVPYDAGVASAYPYRLQTAGGHVAVTVLANPDPPAGCQFPCFSIGFEAWSLDRS